MALGLAIPFLSKAFVGFVLHLLRVENFQKVIYVFSAPVLIA